jgi:hypothetical protein
MLLLGLSVIYQAFLVGSQPLIERADQLMSLFNEVATSIYLYLMLLLTDYMGDSGFREEIGWALLILIGVVVAVNLFKVMFMKIPHFYKKVYFKVKKCLKRKPRKPTISIKPKINFENPTIANSFTNHSNDSFINEYHQFFSIKKEVVKVTQREGNELSEIVEEEIKEVPVIQSCATGRPEVSK